MKYFDYAATSEIDIDMLKEIKDTYNLNDTFYNPSSLNNEGIKSKRILTEARDIIVNCLKCKPNEIIFTSGGSESNNTVLIGTYLENLNIKGHIITTCIEHPSILNTCKLLEKLGWEVTYLSVDNYGIIDIEDLIKSIKSNTKLISIMTSNNEIGANQPIKQIVEIAKKYKIPFHSDYVQAVPIMGFDFNVNNYDMISLSGHKFGGFAGTGILFKKENVKLQPLINGGGQEFGLRSGTENVFGNLFMAKCLEKSINEWKNIYFKVFNLNMNFAESIIKKYGEKVHINGFITNILNISFKNLDGRVIQSLMAQKGFAISTGSACSSNGDEIESYVIKSLKKEKEYLNGTIRISFGFNTRLEDIKDLYRELTDTIDYLYKMEELKNE